MFSVSNSAVKFSSTENSSLARSSFSSETHSSSSSSRPSSRGPEGTGTHMYTETHTQTHKGDVQQFHHTLQAFKNQNLVSPCFRCCSNTNSKHCATLRGLSAVCIHVQRFVQAKDKATPINTIILPPCFTSVFPLFLLKKIPLRLFFSRKTSWHAAKVSADVNPATCKTKPHTDGEREGEKGGKKKKFLCRLFTQASAWEEERKYFY